MAFGMCDAEMRTVHKRNRMGGNTQIDNDYYRRDSNCFAHSIIINMFIMMALY